MLPDVGQILILWVLCVWSCPEQMNLLQDVAEAVADGHRLLANSYILGYFMAWGSCRTYFEDLQVLGSNDTTVGVTACSCHKTARMHVMVIVVML